MPHDHKLYSLCIGRESAREEGGVTTIPYKNTFFLCMYFFIKSIILFYCVVLQTAKIAKKNVWKTTLICPLCS